MVDFPVRTFWWWGCEDNDWGCDEEKKCTPSLKVEKYER
jgi:hypothetical protein